ncbi:IS91 family transposase ISTha3 [Sporomusa rhizae]|uniref:tyrosine-type recombinase/integrase n=1 Tax=Sporomusa rhizae TaxID=357999 RepID=UPI00352B6CD6
MDILGKLLFDLELSGFSNVTQNNYLYHVSQFAKYCKKPLQDTDIEDVRRFLHYMRRSKKLSAGTVNYYHTCIKFLFEVTLEKPWNDKKLPRLREHKPLPEILSREEIDVLLDAAINLKHKAILATVYGGGLRISEVVRLKVKDIDSKTMQIFIRESKGNKDRRTLLSEKNLMILREYWKNCGKPMDWLFPGEKPGAHMTVTAVRNFLKRVCKAAKITKPVTIHMLRHCFATHLLESGVNLFIIKILLGHSSISSTSRYLHLVNQNAFNIKSPLDLPIGDNDA